MTAAYFTVVYRPRGSRCWTPVIRDRPAPVYWHATLAAAQATAAMLDGAEPEDEHRAASVTIDDPTISRRTVRRANRRE